jgi:hypothetical protein
LYDFLTGLSPLHTFSVLIVTSCAKPHEAQEDNGRNQPKIVGYWHKSWSVSEHLSIIWAGVVPKETPGQ